MAEYDFLIWNVGFQDFQCNCEIEVHFQLRMTPMGQKKKEPACIPDSLSDQSIHRFTICKLLETENQEIGLCNLWIFAVDSHLVISNHVSCSEVWSYFMRSTLDETKATQIICFGLSSPKEFEPKMKPHCLASCSNWIFLSKARIYFILIAVILSYLIPYNQSIILKC